MFEQSRPAVPHHSINADKIFGLLRPDRKLHVTHRDAVVTHAELVLIAVDEHLGQVVELWDQLLVADRPDAEPPFSSDRTTKAAWAWTHLYISRVPLAVPPGAADAGEGSFRIVKLVIVGVEEKCGEGLLQGRKMNFREERQQKHGRLESSKAGTHYSEHPHQRGVSSGVKGCVVVRGGAVVIPRLVTLCVKRRSLWVECTDWLEARVSVTAQSCK